MGFNFITNIESCYIDVPGLLYYSHIPPAIIIMLLGFFVLFRSKENRLAGKILFSISILFFIWVTVEGILWLIYSGMNMMFLWSFLGALYGLMHLLSLYFVYAVIDKKDISWNIKYIFTLLLIPIIFLTATRYNLTGFDITNCQALEGDYFLGYRYFVGIVSIIWIIVFLYLRYKKAQVESKKQILLLGFGILSFLLLFSWSEISGSLTQSFEITQYGLFGMPVFVAFLVYIIVKFKAFDIKLIGSQALVVALVILVGSQFFFIQTTTNQVLTGITLVLVGGVGIVLIRSVKEEVKRKEELQMMSGKLAEANDQLRKLDNAKSEFISIASHQLRTPLTAIKGFISLLLEGSYGKFDAKQNEVLNKVYTSNERLISLVEDLLNISRIESGRMEFKFEKCQLADVCQELFDTFALRAKNAGLYLDYKAPVEPVSEVMIDMNKVREVISNLMDNAIKYTPKGGVTVRVEQVPAEMSKIENVGPAGAVRVVISDTGIGVPQTELPYLFSKFSRGKDTSRLNTGGTGLGLYVGRQMVEANGGKVWAESDGEGKGSRFIIEVPVEQSAENLSKWG